MNKSDFDLHHQNQHIESKIIAALERISQAFRVLLWQESTDFSLSPIQVQVLIFLLHHGRDMCRVSYLAREFNMTKATISDTVKALEQKQLILKEYDPMDNRSYTIQLTSAGKETALKTSLFSGEIRKPLTQIEEIEKERLLLNLIEIIRHLHAAGIITIQRMCLTCIHFSPGDGERAHFCKLLNQVLESGDLRVDCPEHHSM